MMKDYQKIIAVGIATLAIGLIWLGISSINPQASSTLMFVAIVIGGALIAAGIEEMNKERKRSVEVPELVKRAGQQHRSLNLKWPDIHDQDATHYYVRLGKSETAIPLRDQGDRVPAWLIKDKLVTEDELVEMILREKVEVC